MKLNDLSPAVRGRRRRRIGRGPGSSRGKTGGRGGKGQTARAGGITKRGFEGGQVPLIRRLPKRGFKMGHPKYQLVNLRDLGRFAAGAHVTPQELREAGIIKNLRLPVKVLGQGELAVKLTVEANAFSGRAKQAIEAAGGEVRLC
ncbi:MAG: 50S ribosomal protein L15 [Deinococcus sp.]|nr:50S ribosomal protein L15 [Deinococcus sp.]